MDFFKWPRNDPRKLLQEVAQNLTKNNILFEFSAKIVEKSSEFRKRFHFPGTEDFHIGFDFEHKISKEEEEKIAKQLEEQRQKKLAVELLHWKENPVWTDPPYGIKVTTPPGSFCDLDCSFFVGLPADAVYDILCDPDNDNVFKNIKAVKSRVVLETRGTFQRALVEQTAVWHFLWLSGTFDVLMEVSTDRSSRKISYRLAQGGFMKRFEGNWDIEAVPVPKAVPSVVPGDDPRMASRVTLRQRLQTAVKLPPPISGYVRGISASSTRSMLADLQAEAARVRSGAAPKSNVLVPGKARAESPGLGDTVLTQRRGDLTRKGGRAKRGSRFRRKIRQGV